MTTEVLRNMIYARSATLEGLGYVVMDEVHYLADRFRGAVWEEVIIGLAESVQLVALSATVSNAEEFGDWLAEVRGDSGSGEPGGSRQVEIVVSERRPVPLYQHVLVGRRLYDLFEDEAPDRDHRRDRAATAGRGESGAAAGFQAGGPDRPGRFPARPGGRSGRGGKRGRPASKYGGDAHRSHTERSQHKPASRADIVRTLENADLLPAIIFIFSRVGCDAAVKQMLGSQLRLTNSVERAEILHIAAEHTAGLTDADLAALEYDTFLDALERGIAAHHAGMLPVFKECVEECFVRGLIKVVCATETLALGINMPARSVVLEKLVKYNGETHADITPGGVHPADRSRRAPRDRHRGPRRGAVAARVRPARGRGGAGEQAYLSAEVVVPSDVQHGGQHDRCRRPRPRPLPAGAVLRAVPDRPVRGRTGPDGAAQHREDRPVPGPGRV